MPRGQEISAYSTCSLLIKDSTRIGRSRVRLAGVDARLMAPIFMVMWVDERSKRLCPMPSKARMRRSERKMPGRSRALQVPNSRGMPMARHAASLRAVRLPADRTVGVCSITPKSESQRVRRDAPRLLWGGAADDLDEIVGADPLCECGFDLGSGHRNVELRAARGFVEREADL